MTLRTLAEKRELSLPVQYLLYLTAFAIPFLLRGPQLVVGSAVNMLLFMAALRMERKHLLPLAILPSLAALAGGMLFGSFTVFLVYFLPMIWLGNLSLMLVARSELALPAAGRMALAAGLKAAVLFAMASLYVQLGWVPAMFTTAMGIVQLQTALIGAGAAWLFLKWLD